MTLSLILESRCSKMKSSTNPMTSMPLILIMLCFFSMPLIAQGPYPRDYFRPPVDFRILLSGTFGELRANHFHSGIDIKTGGVEGKPVYAIADGYVSRIKVSAFGFGKALYVNHPNGYVSVYAHISRYNETIGKIVKDEHYRRESFEIELFPEPGDLPVKKGEIIAWSGNSGSSGGPHLHFEIRDGASQKPINPLLFGYEVKDFYRPKINSIKIYPEDQSSRVNGSGLAQRLMVEGWGEQHRLAGSQVVTLSGAISFGIQVHDQQNDTDNKNGPFSTTLMIDSAVVYQVNMTTFSFDQTRYVNSYIDYEEYVRNNVRLQRTKIDPGNKLDIYEKADHRGIFSFSDTLMHDIRYVVKDVAGNTSILAFKAKSVRPDVGIFVADSPPPPGHPALAEFNGRNAWFSWDSDNRFSNSSVAVDAPKGAFYHTFLFRCDSSERKPGTWSAVFQVHDRYTPVHDYIRLSIRPSKDLPEKLRTKALIARIKEDGTFASEGGEFGDDGRLTTRIREFGRFCVLVDTIPPKIKPRSPELFKNLAGQSAVRFTITDERSGIKAYRGTLNGKWILMDYDAKNNLLVYTLDDRLKTGENQFELVVTDGKDNRTVYKTVMVR